MLSLSATLYMGWMKIPTYASAIRSFILLLTISSIIMFKVSASEIEKDENNKVKEHNRMITSMKDSSIDKFMLSILLFNKDQKQEFSFFSEETDQNRSSKRIDVIVTLVLADIFSKPVLVVLFSYLDVVPHKVTFGPKNAIASPCFSRDSRYFAHTTPGTNTATIWSLETGTIWRVIVDPAVQECYACALAFTNHWLVTSGTDGNFKRWSTQDGGLLQTITPASVFTDTILLVCPTGEWILSGSEERRIQFWYVPTGELLNYEDIKNDDITLREFMSVLFYQSCRYILKIKNKPHELSTFGGCSVIVFSQDRTYNLLGMHTTFTLMAHNNDTGVRTWFEGHTSTIKCCCMSTNQRWVLSGDQTGKLKLWSMTEEAWVGTIVDGQDHSAVLACYFGVDNQYIIAVRSSGKIRIWELRGLLQQFQQMISN